MLRSGTFTRLGPAQRQVLSDWIDASPAGRIDAIVDMSFRPWSVPAAGAIIGIFEPGEERATWLVVEYPPGWILVHCGKVPLTEECGSLMEALSLIAT